MAEWRPWVSENHRPRDDPYPDELDQLFCDECETLCMQGRPCMCCWTEMTETESQAAADA